MKVFLNIALTFFYLGNLIAQQKTYPFINYNSNKIHYGNDSTSFLKLFEKINKLKEKNTTSISVVHIGGSHVQGGAWTNKFHTNLQTEFNTNGGGYFFFPFKMVKTNSPTYVASKTTGKWDKCRCVTKGFCLPLGMSGYSAKTNDSINQFTINTTKYASCKKFNTVKVYHNFNTSFKFNIKNLEAKRVDKEKLGYTEFTFNTLIDSLDFELTKNDTLNKDFILYGFSIENTTEKGFYLATLGANGASSSSFLRCNYFESQLKTIMPDLVIISLGVNDTQSKNFESDEYIKNYDTLITRIKNTNPNVAILLTTTTDNYIRRKTSNKRSITAQAATFELMTKHNAAVWDMYQFMGGYKSIYKWYKAGLAAKDRVHFNNRGYTIMGDYMYQALFQSYKTNTIKK